MAPARLRMSRCVIRLAAMTEREHRVGFVVTEVDA